MGEAIVGSQTSVYLTDGTALELRLEPSPISLDDGTPAPPHSIGKYLPDHASRRPRAPRVDVGRRSTLDLFGAALCCWARRRAG
jgi:hypothetical protein